MITPVQTDIIHTQQTHNLRIHLKSHRDKAHPIPRVFGPSFKPGPSVPTVQGTPEAGADSARAGAKAAGAGQGQEKGQGPTQVELTEIRTLLMHLNKMMNKFN